MSNLIPAVAYYRMSSDKQEASIEDQQTAVMQYAADNGYRIIRDYRDEGISGWKSEQRKGFQKLIADATDRGDFQAVLCWDQDRFSRFDRSSKRTTIGICSTKRACISRPWRKGGKFLDSGRLVEGIRSTRQSRVRTRPGTQHSKGIAKAEVGGALDWYCPVWLSLKKRTARVGGFNRSGDSTPDIQPEAARVRNVRHCQAAKR